MPNIIDKPNIQDHFYIYIYTTCLDDFPTKTPVNEECSIIFHILSTFIDDIPIKTFI
jgi:hypothetical protein